MEVDDVDYPLTEKKPAFWAEVSQSEPLTKEAEKKCSTYFGPYQRNYFNATKPNNDKKRYPCISRPNEYPVQFCNTMQSKTKSVWQPYPPIAANKTNWIFITDNFTCRAGKQVRDRTGVAQHI